MWFLVVVFFTTPSVFILILFHFFLCCLCIFWQQPVSQNGWCVFDVPQRKFLVSSSLKSPAGVQKLKPFFNLCSNNKAQVPTANIWFPTQHEIPMLNKEEPPQEETVNLPGLPEKECGLVQRTSSYLLRTDDSSPTVLQNTGLSCIGQQKYFINPITVHPPCG